MNDGCGHDLKVGIEDQGGRLDVYLAKILSNRYSRSQIKKMIKNGDITVYGREVSAHYCVKGGDEIRLFCAERSEKEVEAEDIPIEIVAEDHDIIVINKAPGMVVHPACGNPRHTLVNAILYHVKTLPKRGDLARPGIVHRLDKDTSGIMVVAKNEKAHAHLSRQFQQHTVGRCYQAVVRGIVQHQEGMCEEPVGRAFLNRKKVIVKPSGGKDAVTYFRVLERFAKATLLEIRPRTGRTHQIRVHMNHMGHPVLGDSLYGVTSPWTDRQALHAMSLELSHPTTGERVCYESPLPSDIQYLLQQLRREK